ncbi:sunset domain-containing protein [Nitrospina watsonii]|uniref:Uncharacterized protein n=1 Tax=Nitrospina watsonii TaxID=1323948 RepID=A0ABM9HBV5_9BACT|nr:hypothetical protein [Nitrospina watsonii]CAI2717717.1 conserved protein of unknown function [Nitrospina watsonii]
MNDSKNDHTRELQQKLEQILKHGDPGVQEMLRDLIREFHHQLMDDPKSRVSMKEQQKTLRALGEKIIRLPFLREDGEEDDEAERETVVDQPRPRRRGRLILLTVALVVAVGVVGKWVTRDEQSPPVRVCDIKGNINDRQEMIYHLPETEWYDKTFVDASRGERWFCSEAEAQAAGWRKSLRDSE